jgi:PAS domain-containing protein
MNNQKHKHKVIRFLMTLLILSLLIWAAQYSIQSIASLRRRNLPMEVRLMDAIVSTGGAIVEVDASTGTIVHCTTNLEKMLRYPAGSLKGQPLDILIPQWFQEAHRKIIAHRHPIEGGETIIIKGCIPRSDGTLTEVVVSVFLVPSGNLIALIRLSEKVRFRDMLTLPSTSLPRTVNK